MNDHQKNFLVFGAVTILPSFVAGAAVVTAVYKSRELKKTKKNLKDSTKALHDIKELLLEKLGEAMAREAEEMLRKAAE